MHTTSFSKTFLCLTLLWFCTYGVSAQIMQKFGDNSNIINDKAVLEIESTTKGFLLPRMNKAQRDLIQNPPEGLMLWCTDCSRSNGSEIVVWVKNSWTGLLISNLGVNNFLLGNADGKATAVTFSGDVTIDNAGVSAIGKNKVVSSMINDGTIITSDIASDAVVTSNILAANVTYSKIQNVTTNSILGRTTSGEGSVEEIATTGNGNVVLSASPSLTGVPLAPTASLSTNTDQIATTAFVLANNTNDYKSLNASIETSTTSPIDLVVGGMSVNPGAGTYSVMFNGQYVSSSAGTTARGISYLSNANQQLLDIATTNLSHSATFGNGETLTAGVYAIGGAGSLSGTLTLNGTADDLFIFKINGALATGAGATVILTGGAQASNVFWVATSAGAMDIAADNKMVGSLFAKDAAASIGAGSTLEGRLFSNTGAITVGTSIVKLPLGSSSINLGELSSYALFTSSGAIVNAGTSTIIGNIGTNTGAITGFTFPTVVDGSIYTPVADLGGALSSFSIYQNGALIANSTRTKMGDKGDISLLAIASVSEGQTIDIRWKTSLGILKLQNRILTLIKVR
ncbi:DUF3494 domain-containing protein [Flavobacterium franklandianum]|uniref:DUF3494 domain-containing protein n=1 Tax=Flavobacterium franklandianum TaxID=2594430 RepID=A0A553C888_9FLAO|nr:ice-binding family protein [Flavobacterium franklandianum]TRX16714.1 DUF3494 domain-containing protein [Flavobacterium franklandianum]TRX29620.1 DUF3494 domain-containing protein [Flavobacterium franklandianum]